MLDVHDMCIISHNIGLDWYVQISYPCIKRDLRWRFSATSDYKLPRPEFFSAYTSKDIKRKWLSEEQLRLKIPDMDGPYSKNPGDCLASSWEALQGATTENLDEDITKLNPVLANSILLLKSHHTIYSTLLREN